MAAITKQQVEDAQKGLDFAKNDYQVELTTTKGPIRLAFLPALRPLLVLIRSPCLRSTRPVTKRAASRSR